MAGFGDIRFSGAKHAPVLFGIDVTGSVTTPVKVKDGKKTRMDMANDMIRQFFEHILSIYKAADAVEVAFVLFTHEIVMETEFVNIMHLSDAMFETAKKTKDCGEWELYPVTVGIKDSTKSRTGNVPRFEVCKYDEGTKIDSAVLYCYEKLLNVRNQYIKDGKEFYAPHFVLVTDGDPNKGHGSQRDDEKTHKNAVDKAFDHCWTGRDGKNLIVPITVGILGEEVDAEAEKRLRDYSENFRSGYFHVRENFAVKDFNKAAEFLCKTLIKSLILSAHNLEDLSDENSEEDRGANVEEIYGE